MATFRSDTELNANFPRPPVLATRQLEPLASWPALCREPPVTGIEFDLFWYECIEEEVAYFFRWTGMPRAKHSSTECNAKESP